MKRFRLWLRELSLSQQMLAIIFLFISAFTVFIFVFLSPSIDRFAETEMFRTLHSSQETLIYMIDQSPYSIPQISKRYDGVVHAIYSEKSDQFFVISDAEWPAGTEDEVRAAAKTVTSGTQDYTVTTDEEKTMVYFYSVTSLKDGRVLVSMLPNEYRVQYRSSLVNSVVMMNILVVSVLFICLMLWISSLIMPLTQIKNYVQKIKNDEPAELNIHRRDEIGEVAEALIDMNEELQKQNREKEEMIQNISHDLKTPIATIKSYGESIKDGIYPYDTLEKSVDVIIEHADRLEKKVYNLIVLNKMGYLLDDCPEGDTLEMDPVIDKVLLSLKVIRPEIEFIRETDPEVKFHGEEEPWRITIENLIDNALRYAKSYIRITLAEDELCVINDGKQISDESLSRMFRAYEKGTDGQFGLGLSIVYKVCTTYGYHVDAENTTEGVCFRIWKDKKAGGRKKKETVRKNRSAK